MIKIRGSLGLIMYLGVKQKTDADKYNNHKRGIERDEWAEATLGQFCEIGELIKDSVP